MSVNHNHYVVYGVQLPYASFQDDWGSVAPAEDNGRRAPIPFSNIAVIADGMNGEYVIVGFILARSNKNEGFDGITPWPKMRKPGRRDRRNKIKEFLQSVGYSLPETVSMQWMAFTHYY